MTNRQKRDALVKQRKALDVKLGNYRASIMKQINAISAKIKATPSS